MSLRTPFFCTHLLSSPYFITCTRHKKLFIFLRPFSVGIIILEPEVKSKYFKEYNFFFIEFITGLLHNIGTHVDPIKLIKV